MEATLSDGSAGVAVNEEGAGFSQERGGAGVVLPDQTAVPGALSPHRAPEFRCQAQSLGPRSPSLKCQPGRPVSCGQPSMSCETRLSAEGKEKRVRRYHPDSSFIFWGLLVAFASDKPLLCLCPAPHSRGAQACLLTASSGGCLPPAPRAEGQGVSSAAASGVGLSPGPSPDSSSPWATTTSPTFWRQRTADGLGCMEHMLARE